MNTNTQKQDSEEEECEHCGGEGVVMSDAPVYHGEPHMASVDTVPCICKNNY